MPNIWANPKRSIAVCDQCGQRWMRKQLKYQVIAGIVTRLLHCPECLDIDNPQLQLAKIRASDPQVIYDPRPDPSLLLSRSEAAFNPCGGASLTITMYPESNVVITTDSSIL